MKRGSIILTLAMALWAASPSLAQDEEGSLLDLLGPDEPVVEFASASFKTTRVINAHSIENTGPGVLDFKISHRFGRVNSGVSEWFGLDQATVRLGLDYGITDRLMVGAGRSSYEKTVDGFIKYKFLRQSSGVRIMPVTASFLAAGAINTLPWAQPERENYFSSRLYYTFQLIVGRKFSDTFTVQLMPTVVHRNLVRLQSESHDVLVMGAAGRHKLTRRVAVNAEYFYVLPNQLRPEFTNSFTLGFDIETGGHVFQLHFTNSIAMNEKAFVTETTGDWGNGDIHFGFNISRVFQIKKPKLPKAE